MSSVLLNTRTGTLLELLGNGRVYQVPAFQRDYSWTETEWEDLWDDLNRLRQDADERHYMGTVVLSPASDREMRIIDGQQRLATLSVLALAVVGRLLQLADQALGSGDVADANDNRERANAIRARFLGDKDPASLREVSKLRLNDANDEFYQDFLLQLKPPNSARALTGSNRALWNAFKFFESRIASDADLGTNGEAVAALLSDVAARRLYFIVIEVDDELNAYTVFETLNARGTALSATDLLKNYLFSRVKSDSDRDAVHRQWRRILSSVGDDRVVELLRYHLSCEVPQVRSRRIYKMMRDRVANESDTFALLDILERRAEVYAALDDPDHLLWSSDAECRTWVTQLRLLGVRQMTPLVFAVAEKVPRLLAKTLKMVVMITVRHSIVVQRSPNELERPYHDAARRVLDGTATKPEQIFASLRALYPADSQFEAAFAALELAASGRQKKLVRYILLQLESPAGEWRSVEEDRSTVEHIVPENPSRAWMTTFSTKEHDQYVHRLGNYLLLESTLNRRAGHSAWSDKLQIFAQSLHPLAKELVSSAPGEWNPAEIEERQKRMAKQACRKWRLDYE